LDPWEFNNKVREWEHNDGGYGFDVGSAGEWQGLESLGNLDVGVKDI
jgi:hypothetical protein